MPNDTAPAAQPQSAGEARNQAGPESLDQIVATTRPRLWLALISLLLLIALGIAWIFLGRVPLQATAEGVVDQPQGMIMISAPVAGAVEILIEPFTTVVAGTPIASITPFADNPKTTILAAGPGVIAQVLVQDGEGVEAGATLLVLDPPDDSSTVRILAFPSANAVRNFKAGQRVSVLVGGRETMGTVLAISDVPAGADGLEAAGIQPLTAQNLLANKDYLVYQVVIEADRPTGVTDIRNGEIATVTNTYETASPVALMFGSGS
ncbi:MAG: hypothetical protein F2793_07825 [Actinobacteria bacterium]|nr:hypothetical protein [Actinomycetota bacterium]